MGNLTNKYIKDTYDGLIKLADETQGVQPTSQKLQDGVGNDLPAQVSSTEFTITGSLVGNADTATSASHAVQADNADTATTASFALTASHAENYDDIYVTGMTFVTESTAPDGGELTLQRSQGASDITVDLDGRYQTIAAAQNENLRLDFIEFATASLNAYTASNGDIRNDFNSYTSSQESVDAGQNNRLDSLSSKTGSYATTGSNIFTGQQTINDDLIIQGNLYVSGSETIISSSTLIVGDREIELNANRTVGNAGIIVYDVVAPEGTGSLQYDVTNNYWIAGQYGSEEKVILQSDLDVATVESSLRTTITAKNVTAAPIQKGTPCYITGSGTSGNLVGVIPADAGDPSLMPAGVVLNETLNAGDEGSAVVVGFISGVDTSLFEPGDNVWVAVGGGYTNERPTGSALVQKLGNVEKSAVNGSGVISGPGRSNDVPNLPEGYIFVGDSDQVAQTVSTGSFARRDEVNTFSEDQTINGSLTINAQDSSPFSIASGSSNISVQMGEFGGQTQPEIIFSGDNSFFSANNNFVVSADNSMDIRSNGANATLQSNNNSSNILAGDKIILSGSNQLNIDTSNFTLTDSTLNTTIQKPGSGQDNLIDINGQVGFYSGYPSMTQVNLGLQSLSSQYNGFVFELYDGPSYNWGSDFAISANGVYGEVIGSGSGATGEVNVFANTVGITFANLKAQYIDIGDSSTTDIDIASAGPNSTVTGLYGNNIDIGSTFGYTDDIDIDANNFIRLDSAQISLSGSVDTQNNLTVNGQLNLNNNVSMTPGVTNIYGNSIDYYISAGNYFAVSSDGGNIAFYPSNGGVTQLNNATEINGTLTINSSVTTTQPLTTNGTLNINNDTNYLSGVNNIYANNIDYYLSTGSYFAISSDGGDIAFYPSNGGATQLNNNTVSNGSFTANGGITIANNGLTVTGNSTFNNNVDITGSLNLTDGIVANGYNEIGGGGQLYVNGHFEASGFSKFTNNLQVTGSLGVSGSMNLIQSKPATGTQANIIDITGQQGYYSGFPLMTQTNLSLQSYSSQQYNGLVTEMWDSPSYNWGVDFAVSANGVFSEVIASGSGNVAELNVYSTNAGTTFGSYRAQNIDIGTNSDLATLDLGYIGPSSATTKLAGNLVYVGSNFGYTDEIYIDANNELRLDGTDVNITGSVNIQDTMTLAPQDPLPAGGLGELAVSSSNELYFHNGTDWNLIA